MIKNNNNNALRSQTPFMSENHPLNPYGNNFIDHPYESKIFYKFNSVKQYVHLEEDDQFRISKYSAYFAFGLGGTLIGTIGGFHLLLKYVFKPYYTTTFEHFNHYKHLYLGLLVASSVTFMYTYLTTLYINNVSRPLLYKYLDEAKKNGFQDYEISFKQQ
ncbi:unnamed protein product [Paramecium pentaurelia]|uniref:Transmembrane protein n=1 Tax=Paramecium pentaurelia TaxID=43138 RepID=A0A8S1W0M3_9CILI|nr:unnamed protein product [Paramecium pentaurelia]